MYSYTLILKDKYSNKYIFISHILAGNDKTIKHQDIKTKQPLSGDMYGNITLFGLAVDHLLPEGSSDPSATPNSLILPYRSPGSGSFVIITCKLRLGFYL